MRLGKWYLLRQNDFLSDRSDFGNFNGDLGRNIWNRLRSFVYGNALQLEEIW